MDNNKLYDINCLFIAIGFVLQLMLVINFPSYFGWFCVGIIGGMLLVNLFVRPVIQGYEGMMKTYRLYVKSLQAYHKQQMELLDKQSEYKSKDKVTRRKRK